MSEEERAASLNGSAGGSAAAAGGRLKGREAIRVPQYAATVRLLAREGPCPRPRLPSIVRDSKEPTLPRVVPCRTAMERSCSQDHRTIRKLGN